MAFRKAINRALTASELRALPAEARFWHLCGKQPGCWAWEGYTSAGYAALRRNGKHVKAHRLSYEITHGPIPDGLSVCHSCDNTVCTNWSHLFLGTHAINMADRDAKGRQGDHAGEANGRSKITLEQVGEIRSLWAVGGQTKRELGRQYGITDTAIAQIVNNRTWRAV